MKNILQCSSNFSDLLGHYDYFCLGTPTPFSLLEKLTAAELLLLFFFPDFLPKLSCSSDLQWTKIEMTVLLMKKETKLQTSPQDQQSLFLTHCIHWCTSSNSVSGVMTSGVTLMPLFGQITTGLSQTAKTQDSDFTWERRVWNVSEMALCIRNTDTGTERERQC